MQKSLAELNETDWKLIKDLAAAFYSPREIAIAAELNISEFVDACAVEGNECFNAVYGDRMKSEYEVRVSIIKVAKAGSVPAQSMAMDMFNKSKIKWTEK